MEGCLGLRREDCGVFEGVRGKGGKGGLQGGTNCFILVIPGRLSRSVSFTTAHRPD